MDATPRLEGQVQERSQRFGLNPITTAPRYTIAAAVTRANEFSRELLPPVATMTWLRRYVDEKSPMLRNFARVVPRLEERRLHS